MPGPFLCGPLPRAPLLPKLRGHFAEFLGSASSAGLGILSPSACVGFRYGPGRNNSGFSRQRLRALRYSLFAPRHAPGFRGRSSLPAASCACTGLSVPGSRFPAASPHFLSVRGAGIFTCCPSGTPSGLPLGPDLPGADQLYPGNLGYSAGRIPTSLSLLVPAFSLPVPPPSLPARLHRFQECSPTSRHLCRLPGFGGVFEPRTFSARDLSASELLRTL